VISPDIHSRAHRRRSGRTSARADHDADSPDGDILRVYGAAAQMSLLCAADPPGNCAADRRPHLYADTRQISARPTVRSPAGWGALSPAPVALVMRKQRPHRCGHSVPVAPVVSELDQAGVIDCGLGTVVCAPQHMITAISARRFLTIGDRRGTPRRRSNAGPGHGEGSLPAAGDGVRRVCGCATSAARGW